MREEQVVYFQTSKGLCIGTHRNGKIILTGGSLKRIRELFHITREGEIEGFDYKKTYYRAEMDTETWYWILIELEDSHYGTPEYKLTLGL